MSLADVNCMTCLVNVARGLGVEDDLRIRWRGVAHAAVWEMGPGLVVAACKYEPINPHGSYVVWHRKRQHG